MNKNLNLPKNISGIRQTAGKKPPPKFHRGSGEAYSDVARACDRWLRARGLNVEPREIYAK